ESKNPKLDAPDALPATISGNPIKTANTKLRINVECDRVLRLDINVVFEQTRGRKFRHKRNTKKRGLVRERADCPIDPKNSGLVRGYSIRVVCVNRKDLFQRRENSTVRAE